MPRAARKIRLPVFGRYDRFGSEDVDDLTRFHVADFPVMIAAPSNPPAVLRAGKWILLTRDHSVVQQMVDAGALPHSAAANRPNPM